MTAVTVTFPRECSRPERTHVRVWLLWLFLCLSCGHGLAFDDLSIEFGPLQAPGLIAQEAGLVLKLGPGEAVAVRLQVSGIQSSRFLPGLTGLVLDCPHGRLRTDGGFACTAAEVALQGMAVKPGKADFEFDPVRRHLEGTLSVELRGGRLRADIELSPVKTRVKLRGRGLALQKLIHPSTVYARLESATGGTDFDLMFQQIEDKSALNTWTRFTNLTFADASGLLAGEGLDVLLRGEFHGSGRAWTGAVSLDVTGGAVFSDPMFLDFSTSDLSLSTDIGLTAERLSLMNLRIAQTNLVVARGRADLDLTGAAPAIIGAALEVPKTALQPVYETYLKPWFAAHPLGDLTLSGTFALSAGWDGRDIPDLNLELVDLDFENGRKQFGGHGLNGTFVLGRGNRTPSEFRWAGGYVYDLSIGAAGFHGLLNESGFALAQPFELSVFDGGLLVERLIGRGLWGRDPVWRFSGALTPISMQTVSESFGWLPFNGRLSGMIPEVEYRRNRLAINGALLVRAFDGSVVIRDLVIDDPFGIVPVVNANIDIRGLDLESLTAISSFGKIEGRLDGYVRALELREWRPTAFDARIGTPVGDESRRRISQTAVDNLTALGGGPAGAFSKTFLRIFESFGYERLGLACVLKNQVCAMDGVARTEQGYYIVKGAGMPRVDVIGFNKRVDWEVLIDRLANQAMGGSIVIE